MTDLHLAAGMHARRRIPRRAKAKNADSGDNPEVRRTELREKKINIAKTLNAKEANQTSEVDSDNVSKDTQKFEFVTITGQPTFISRNETSKKVRTQAMRDYLRKQNKQAMTGIVEVVTSVNPESPSRYKGRFKLNTWSHKNQTKAINKVTRNTKHPETLNETTNGVASNGSDSGVLGVWRPMKAYQFPNTAFYPSPGGLDPFDTLSVNLGPHSERLLVHYQTVYFMNSVAINAEGDFFSHVKTDPALFHSILYLVALHFDLKYGLRDSPATLYHGGEAFRMINERLGDAEAGFSDMTIAAVAMLVNKENLDGRYEVSKMHMKGLQHMLRSRGGVHELRGVFRRIVLWSDFCFANVWNIQPIFPRLPLTPPTSPQATFLSNSETLLRPSHLFGSASPIVPIITSLRTLSHDLSPERITRTNRLAASNEIYNLEYDLLLLNKLQNTDPDLNRCIFAFEAVPLKMAAHIYLWLAIRELPPTSELLYRLLQRLHGSLEPILPGWWNADRERMEWLLWILFVGGAAADGREERAWFVSELGNLCTELEIWTLEALKEALRRVVWQEAWCADRCAKLWDDLTLFEELDSQRSSLDLPR